jgi:hypothetical protein
VESLRGLQTLQGIRWMIVLPLPQERAGYYVIIVKNGDASQLILLMRLMSQIATGMFYWFSDPAQGVICAS